MGKNIIKTTIADFLSESVDNNLDTKIIGKSIFEYKGYSYRLSSFEYVYDFKDGGRIMCFVDKKDANAVGGEGIAGCVAKLSDVTFISRQTRWDDDTCDQEQKFVDHLVEEDKRKFELMKEMPLNLTQKEYQDISLDRVTAMAMKSFKNNEK